MAKRTVINLIKRYAQVLRNHGFPVSAVYLFGSHARGQADKDSDIDIMVVSPIFDVNRLDRAAELWKLTAEVDLRIEPIPAGEKAFQNDHVTPIYEIVRQEGIRVV